MKDAEKTLLETVRRSIHERKLVPRGGRVAAAVSGGADSVCLLHALAVLCCEMGFTLCAAHLNHGIRGADADADQIFVRDLAQELGLEFYTETVNVPELHTPGGSSLEQLCRAERLKFYERALNRMNADTIATGHTLDDQAETLLMRLFRGTSPSGLAGMDFRNGHIIRPLLDAPRELVRAFCEQKNIAFREDATNRDQSYDRNRVRHTLLPLLHEQFNPRVEQALWALSQLARRDADFLDELTQQAYVEARAGRSKDRVLLFLEPLRKLHPALLSRVLVLAFYKAAEEREAHLEQRHIEDMVHAALHGRDGLCLCLPAGLDLLVQGDRLVLAPRRPAEDIIDFCYELPLSGREEVFNETFVPPGIELTISIEPARPGTPHADPDTALLDADLLGEKLCLRNARHGDRFRPLGMRGMKKLQDFFTDEKEPAHRRWDAPVLLSGDDIAWVVGRRIDDRFKVTDATRRVLRIQVAPVKNFSE